MSHNTFGHLFRVTTWGESHGPAIGCVVDGCPPGLPLEAAEIQVYLDKRRPGRSRFVTQRREPDEVEILSGVFPDDAGRQVTTGAPIALLIRNVDQRSKDYGDIAQTFRPGMPTTRTWRSTGSATIAAAGAPRRARRPCASPPARSRARSSPELRFGVRSCRSGRTRSTARWDWEAVEANPFFCPDAQTAKLWEDYLDGVRKAGSSIGAIVEIVAEGVPAGLGAPVYGKLDQDIASAMMSINAVKGVEIGDGMGVAELTGEENADEMRLGSDGRPLFLSNHAGGILGGISSGQPIVCRFAVKPTSSILTPRRTIDRAGRETEIVTKGRHDPCVGIRAVPVGEAMMALALADHLLRHRAQCGATSR